MYVPEHFAETDVPVLHGLIRSHPLGTWVAWVNGGLVANHLPFLVDPSRGRFGTLVGHVARANPVWHALVDTTPSVVVFQGPQKYITPSWYAAKMATGKVVPTWNYAVVHAHGRARLLEEAELHELLMRLSSTYETGREKPWRMSELPADFVSTMLRAIVGFEIEVERLEGKFKLSQNRPAEVPRVISELEREAPAVAALMREQVPG